MIDERSRRLACSSTGDSDPFVGDFVSICGLGTTQNSPATTIYEVAHEHPSSILVTACKSSFTYLILARVLLQLFESCTLHLDETHVRFGYLRHWYLCSGNDNFEDVLAPDRHAFSHFHFCNPFSCSLFSFLKNMYLPCLPEHFIGYTKVNIGDVREATHPRCSP